MPSPAFDPIPDAVGAVIAAVLAEYPAATAQRLGERVVDQLRRDGWVIFAPSGRATKTAVADPPDAKLLAR